MPASIRGWPTRIAAADLIIYAPGTQHSSLFPSYLTPGLSAAIARNLRAIKLLITNIQSDAEIAGSSAVDIIDRAVYYLKEKGTPTHADAVPHHALHRQRPGARRVGRAVRAARADRRDRRSAPRPHRQLRGRRHRPPRRGEDPRAVRRSPSSSRRTEQRLAVLLHDAGSLNKITQTLLEMVRGGIEDVPVDVTVFYEGAAARRGVRRPAAVPACAPSNATPSGSSARPCATRASTTSCCSSRPGCTAARTSSTLASHLSVGRLDAVWGSRRLSVRDIDESLRFRYRHNTLLRRDQLRRQPRAEPRVPAAVRPLHLRHAVGGARRPHRRCARDRRAADAQARQPAPARGAAAPQGGDPRDPRAVLPDLARAGEAHERARRPAGARRARARAVPRAATVPRPQAQPPRGARVDERRTDPVAPR